LSSFADIFTPRASGGSGSGVGGIDYFEGSIDLGTNLDGISTYDDTGAYVDGTGGSPSAITISRRTSSPLDADGDLQIAKAASSATGEGVSLLSAAVDIADLGRKLWVSFEWDGTAANYVSNDMKLYAYDVTNSAILPVIPVVGATQDTTNFVPQLPNLKTKVQCYIIPPSTCTQVRVSLHCLTDNASASAYDVFVARPRLSPDATVPGAIVTPWQSYTPTITAQSGSLTNFSLTNTAYKRVGSDLYIRGTLTFTGSPGTWTNPQISLPSGLTTASGQLPMGRIITSNPSNVWELEVTIGTSTDRVRIVASASATDAWTNVTNTTPFSYTTNDNISWSVGPIRVNEWQVASAALTTTEIGLQTVNALIRRGTNQSISATNDQKVLLDTVEIDNFAGFNPANNRWVCPKPALYDIRGVVQADSTLGAGLYWSRIYVNGVSVAIDSEAVDSVGNPTVRTSTRLIRLNRDDFVELYVGSGTDSSYTVLGSTATAIATHLAITEVPDFTTFAPLFDNTDVELYLDSGNGHGSTNTRIRRFSNIRKQTGRNVYYTYNSATENTEGAAVTISVPGLYRVNYSDGATVGYNFGVSVNTSAISTAMGSGLSYGQGKRAFYGGLANGTGHVSVELRLNAGDVVRPHTDGNPNGTSDNMRFQLIRIGN
jgi:hypothetical protein